MKTNKIFGLILIVISVLFFTGVGVVGINQTALAADTTIKWRCATYIPTATAAWGKVVLPLVDSIKKQTNGRLVIEPYPVGALLPSKEVFNAVKRGMVEMAYDGTGIISDIPLMRVIAGVPMNFKATWECVYMHHRLGWEKMIRDECAKHGLYGHTGYAYPLEPCFKKPVRSLEDFNGLKIRSSGIMQTFLSSIGAAASYLTGPDVYPALASGVIDGAHWGAVRGANSIGLYELAKYHLRPPLTIATSDIWLINQKALSKIPEDIQKLLKETMDVHFFLNTTQSQYDEEHTLAKVQKKNGVKISTFPPEDFAKMQKIAFKIWDDLAKKGPQCAKAIQMLKDFNKSLGR